MVGVLLVLLFVATFLYAVTRTARKVRTLMIGLGVMIGTELIAVTVSVLISLHEGSSRHGLAFGTGFAGVLALPVAILAGTVASLIVSSKNSKALTTEGRR
jgi:hypothetical protein